VEYVNFMGERVALDSSKHAKPKKAKNDKPKSFHNGWRVVGIPPGTLEDARSEHAKAVKAAGTMPGAKLPKEWDEGNWLMNAKRRPVRSKPYEIPEAAEQCKEMAERAGWLRVEVVELKQDATIGEQQ
jgi:hypothetical protein